jgi:hypothetical protein
LLFSQSIIDVNVEIARYAMAIDLAKLNLHKIRKVDAPLYYQDPVPTVNGCGWC